MRNLTLLLAVLALYGLMLLFGANVLAATTHDAAALVSSDDHVQSSDSASHALWCDKEEDGDDASRTPDCDDGDDDNGDDASRKVWCDKEEDGDDASRTVWCDKDENGDDASRTVWCDKDEDGDDAG
jgi:hypothetical protein